MSNRGFTLIELIISTGIIMMVIAATMPAFLAFQSKQVLVSSAQQLRDMILETQNYALAPRPNKLPGADGYRIVFTLRDGPGYQIDEQSNSSGLVEWVNLKKGKLPKGVTFCSFSNSSLSSNATNPLNESSKGIVYSIGQLGKITSPDPATNTSLIIVLKHQALAEQERISVGTQTGRVDIELINANGACNV